MRLKDLVQKTRCYRRFDNSYNIAEQDLLDLVDLARLTSSAKNMQPLRYIVSNEKNTNGRIFETLAWAGYLTDWDGPSKTERPSAYLVQLLDTTITTNNYCDHGLAAQSILLGATEKGFGGCIIAAIDKERLRENLQIPNILEILQVIVLGKPAETVILDELKQGESHKYWRDKQNRQRVPKRTLDDIIFKTYVDR
jgi:nitroreductase